MIFQDKVVKKYLTNVYFVTGTACSGKTTVSRELAKRHNLIKDFSNLIDDYCNRPGHQGFRDFINSISDIENAKAVCNAVLKSLNGKVLKNIRNSGYYWIERTHKSTVDETVGKVERHLGLVKNDFSMNVLEIKKVDKDTDLADKLIYFVENFSWEDVKEHMLGMLRAWEFTDWETSFAAIVNAQIVGMASIMKTDYYPLPEIYPWVSSVFVAEDYRGYRISEKLIDFANGYAKENKFDRTYIPSEHTGLYEKYGYRYLKDIVNYGNGKDRLYVKELNG